MNIPQNKPRDKEKYRQQYLANLQLENSNNTLNLNASKMYKATGASSQVASTMTGAEKLAGLEGLKQIAKDHLISLKFCNPLSAQEAVDALNPDDIKFMNEYIQFIGTDFKGRNVPGKVITQYIKKLRKKLEETEGVDYGIQQQSGAGILLTGVGDIYSQGDIQETVMRCNQVGFAEQVINEIFSLMNKLNRQASGINLQRAQKEGPERYALALKANSAFRENAPTIEQIHQMIEDDDPVAIISALQGAGRIDDYVASVGQEASNGPVSASAPTGVGESGVEGIDGVGDPLYAKTEDNQLRIQQAMISFMNLPAENKVTVLQSLSVDTSSFTSEDELNNAFYQTIISKSPSQPFVSSSAPSPAMLPSPSAMSPSPASMSPMTSEGSESAFGSPSNLPFASPSSLPSPPSSQSNPTAEADTLANLLNYYLEKGASDPTLLEPSKSNGKLAPLYRSIEHFHHYAKTISPTVPDKSIPEKILAKNGLANDKQVDSIFEWISNTYNIIRPIYESSSSASTPSNASLQSPATIGSQGTKEAFPPTKPAPLSTGNEPVKGSSIRGRGISSRSAYKVDKYDKPKPYRQFGKHIIHRRKLDDGILMIKYPSGSRIKEVPTQKIGEGLTNVLKEMSDGKMPQYHHFQGLGDKDKELLHHIVRTTQFQDMAVPPPNKEALDKELDRFEILKGEIEAGNDNKELIKEFKVMLMKFMRQGRLPKAQVNEIMEHLLIMGH